MFKSRKVLSAIMAIVMFATSICVSFFAFAVSDLTSGYDLQVYYYNENKEFVEVTEQLSVMEQEDIQLYACLVYDDGTIWDITTSGFPIGMEGYTLEWHSDARYLAFCEKNDGKIHGYDATKGEAIRNWLDNEVGTIPVVGEGLKKLLLGMLDNKVTDIDNLDTEDVTKILDKALETINVNEETRNKLTQSLADYLNKFDVGISAILRDADGNEVTRDTIRLLVLKSNKLLSDVIPNAAFIKNYDNIPRTVAVGYEMDLDGIITPVRTHYKCAWTVTGQLGVLGSDLAEVDENGHFKAIGEGTVQVKVSPDINGLTESLSKAFGVIAAAGELVDSEMLAKAILLILGIPSNSDNYQTLVNIIKAIADAGVIGSDGSLTFGADIMKPLANFILYVIYQDAVTIKIVKPSAIPIESFDIEGDEKVEEGKTETLKITNVKPEGAVAHDYKVEVQNEEYAVQVDDLTFLGIDGSTWNANYVTSNDTNVIVTMDGIQKKFKLKVFANGNTKVVYVKINCDQYLDIDTPTDVEAVTYPKRIDKTELQYGWEYEDGSVVYATADEPAYTEDGLAYVTVDGIMYATGCTVNNLVVKENKNGAIQKKEIMSGIQTTGVEFTKKHFWKKADSGVISSGIRGSVCEVSAYILPADASFNELTFTSANTENVILSDSPLTNTQYLSAALTEERRLEHKTATVQTDEDGLGVVYAYAIGNDACYSDISVTSRTGGFVDNATVAFANISVTDVTIVSDKMDDPEIYLEAGSYQITAGEEIKFDAIVQMSQAGNWKNQGFEDVDWSVDNEDLAFLAQDGTFRAIDVGNVTVTATSIFGEISKSVSVKILPDYRALKAAMAECDYDNLDPYDWSYDSWDTFDAYYQEAVTKLSENSFVSQREVDELTENIINSFNGLVRYLPLTGLDIFNSDDGDRNGFATINVDTLKDYTKYSSTIVPTVYPAEAEDYKITYTSSNPDKITVDANGVCRPVSEKDAAWSKITVTVTDPKNGNQFSKEMYVAFAKYQVKKVSVDKNSIHFSGVGADAQVANEKITAKLDTDSALTSPSIKYGFFVSSDDTIATVDNDGLVTPVGIGKCTITFYSYDGGYTAVTNVSVTTNKKNLEEAINKANALVEEFYTEESFEAVQIALAEANKQFNDENALQTNINKATADLNDALSKLVKNPYANVYLSATVGGSVKYENELYRGQNNKVRMLIENGLLVTAVADEGYHFKCWKDVNGNVISTRETELFTIDYSAYYTAEFEEVHSVTGIQAFVDGNDVEYYSVDVGALANYKNQKAKITYTVFPSNANFYRVEMKTTSTTVDISSDGTISPNDNNTCYAVVDVIVTNTITGESFKDTVTVSFVKYQLKSVSANPNTLVFNGANSANQQISIDYSSGGNSTPSLRKGFFETENDKIAIVDSNGWVIPQSIGSTRIKFTAYDGGYTCYATVKVYANKDKLIETINSVDHIIQRNYTADSYQNVISNRNNALNTYNTEYATQEEVDNALSNLENAIASLVELDLVDFDITIEGNGTVSYDEFSLHETGSFEIKNGDTVTIKATPDDDNEFIGWFDVNGNQVSTNLEYTTIVSGVSHITARFNKLIYIESIEMTAGGKTATFYTHDVGALQDYSKQSVELGVNIYPSNPTHYNVRYYIGDDNNNLVLEGRKLHPNSNNNAYGTVYVVVTDESNGKTYTDYAVINFAKTMLKGLTADTYDVVFYGEQSESQLVTMNYSSGGNSNPSTRRGFAEVMDSNIATVSTEIVDGMGTGMRIYPNKIGSTTAKFTAYDAGYNVTVNVKVYADKNALKSSLEQASQLNVDDYTDESFAAIPAIINYAGSVYNTEYASQAEVDEATSGLVSAMNALVKKDVITIKVSSIGNGRAELNGVVNGTVKIDRGDKITINSVPEEGYEVEAWYDENGNFVSKEQTLTFTAENAHTYIAKFRKIIYVSYVTATVEGNENNFYSKTGFAGSYANQSANVGVNIYPANADDYSVSYSLGKANNMSISGTTVKPSSNNTAYAQVIVTVKDNKSGKVYTDDVYVSFSKNQIKSVSVNPTSISFADRNDSSRTISASYTLDHSSTTLYGNGIKAGFFVSSNEKVAAVSSSGVVTPVGVGSCTITFYSYDAGKTATTSVTVGGTANAYGRVVMMNSLTDDKGTIGVQGATVTIDGKAVKTDSNGNFTLQGFANGTQLKGEVTYANGVSRTFWVRFNGDAYDVVVPIIAVDYVNDGVINAKDYAKMKKNKASNEMLENFQNFVSSKHYTSSSYKTLNF